MRSVLEDLVCSSTTQEVRPDPLRRRWRGPPEDWVKVNTDASFSALSASGASGVVLRNSQGEVIAALARAYTNIADVTMAEALAARDGVLLASEQAATKVILEVDNLQVASLIRSENGLRSAISGIWHEIKELSSLFSAFDVSFVHREGNEAAHRCASMPSANTPFLSWSGSLPNWLMEIADRDCNDSLN